MSPGPLSLSLPGASGCLADLDVTLGGGVDDGRHDLLHPRALVNECAGECGADVRGRLSQELRELPHLPVLPVHHEVHGHTHQHQHQREQEDELAVALVPPAGQ